MKEYARAASSAKRKCASMQSTSDAPDGGGGCVCGTWTAGTEFDSVLLHHRIGRTTASSRMLQAENPLLFTLQLQHFGSVPSLGLGDFYLAQRLINEQSMDAAHLLPFLNR
jgi:hypothetical protein